MTVKAKKLKEQKVKAVEQIKEKIAASKLMVLTDYRGMSMKQMTELRKKLRENDAEFKVLKNTYVVKALPSDLSSLADSFAGSIAVLFGFSDVVAPAKTLVTFIGENEKPVLLQGVVENQVYKDSQIKALAKLPSKQELIAKTVGAFKSPLYGLVSVTQGPIRKLVYGLDAIRKQKSEGGEK